MKMAYRSGSACEGGASQKESDMFDVELLHERQAVGAAKCPRELNETLAFQISQSLLEGAPWGPNLIRRIPDTCSEADHGPDLGQVQLSQIHQRRPPD